jgi:Transposase DDE domain group 1
MQNTACRPKITVSADGAGIVSHAGGLLLTGVLRVTGLDAGLAAALGRWKAPRAVHDPGKIVADLAVALALGGDCLADITALRAEPALFGPVASDPVVSRLVSLLAADAPRALRAIRAARAPPPGNEPGRWPGTPRRDRTAGWSPSTSTRRS